MADQRIEALARFCMFLAETETSFATARFPGLRFSTYIESWSDKNPDSTLKLPKSLVAQPFIKAATRSYEGETCIWGVDTMELLAWMVNGDYITQEESELVLAEITLEMMGG